MDFYSHQHLKVDIILLRLKEKCTYLVTSFAFTHLKTSKMLKCLFLEPDDKMALYDDEPASSVLCYMPEMLYAFRTGISIKGF